MRTFLIIVGIIIAVPALMFVYLFFHAFHDDNIFNAHCTLQSEYPLQHKRSYACDDGFTYWKENGIITSAIGKKGATPKYGSF